MLAETRVLVLTTFDLDEYIFGALYAGASGFLLKGMEPLSSSPLSESSTEATCFWPQSRHAVSSRPT